ncbi:MAG: toxic anion resistance protein [Candidatus Magnetoovum sp. WYHC-5]|nr:toxic anion resistance protein [Candidatus Magnetoovum sp. WYHC-5]
MKETAMESKEKNGLLFPDELTVRQELDLVLPKDIQAVAAKDPELDSAAEKYADMLINFKAEDHKEVSSRKEAVEGMGLEIQKRVALQSKMLQEPIKKLSKSAEDGGPVANALIDLRMQVEELDPGKFDFEAGWFTRIIGRMPGVGTPLKRYFIKFEQAQTLINAIIRSLEDGKEQLIRDNKTLQMDQQNMRQLTLKLEKTIKLGQLIDQKLEYKLSREIDPAEEERIRFIQEELLFPIRQRIVDLLQQLAVNQQGVMAIEIIMRNNKELIRGVNRALSVTLSSLQVAVTVALALANQKIVLDKIDAINKTTSELISNTAARLKTQGTAIHKQASSSMLDMNTLKGAFNDIYGAIDELSTYRREALPKLSNLILDMDNMTQKAEKSIKTMERGNEARPSINIDIE